MLKCDNVEEISMQNKVCILLKNEISGWKQGEIIWLVLALTTIIGLSLYWGETLLGVVSAASGIMCVVCTGKGKLSAYIFGAVNTLLYASIAFSSKYYGEVMLNVLYYFPLQFYGFYVWNKNIDAETKEVKKRNMSRNGFVILWLCVAVITVAYGILLSSLGGKMPFVDALSTVVSVVAMIVSIKMFAEQWLLWIAVNVVTIFMWGYAFFVQDAENIATLLMWIVYLLNSIIMYVKWKKEANNSEGAHNEI